MVQDSKTNGGKLLCRFSSRYRKLLDRVAFRILSNINDGAPLRKYVERFQMIGLMVITLMVFYTCGELVLRRVGPTLRNGENQLSEVFHEKRCKHFTKFTGKHLRTEKHFRVDFAKFLGTPFLQNFSKQLLLNGYGIQGKHYVALLQKSEMLVELHSRNLMLSISPIFHLFVFDVNQGNEEAS